MTDNLLTMEKAQLNEEQKVLVLAEGTIIVLTVFLLFEHILNWDVIFHVTKNTHFV